MEVAPRCNGYSRAKATSLLAFEDEEGGDGHDPSLLVGELLLVHLVIPVLRHQSIRGGPPLREERAHKADVTDGSERRVGIWRANTSAEIVSLLLRQRLLKELQRFGICPSEDPLKSL